ncbi:MAG: carboxypeptidase regulatory-like domain-containing protein, partial [Rhodospirillales bacterium]|nr:carboxypeptidase regulatory-like domain-containing protein [Rhodospirillales bacterium]
ANGVQDAGDTGIAGVTVNLLDASGATVLGTTVTDGSGLYSFTSLAAGTYEVAFLQPAGYAFSPTGAGTPDTDSNPNQGTGVTGPISLADGQVDNSIDAGLYRPAALGDYVFEDANANGVQDSGETGIAGVTVNLLSDDGSTTLGTTTTNSWGLYSFVNLTPGAYEVQFVQPIGYNFSPTGAGTPATDSNPDQTTGITAPVTLVSGQNDITIDAGLVAQGGSHGSTTAALGDYVFEDVNANGVQDAGDTGIAGVTVNLLDASGGTVLGTTTTDGVGHYAFTDLAPGSYEVAFANPGGYSFSPTGAGTPATDSNPDRTTGITTPVTLVSGQNDTTIDAGLYRLAALGDYVFNDLNANGIQDSGDTGVSGITVNLLDATGATVLGTTTTNATGYYSFTSLTPGAYEVQFVKPLLATFSPTGAGTPATDSNPDQTTGITAPVTLVSGQNDITIDAGLVLPPPTPPPSGSIGDYVWNDCNWNGIQDGCEVGISGVTVNLLSGSGSSVLATTTTDATGHYQFSGLAVGTYSVQFVAPAGTTFSAGLQGTDVTLDSNVISIVGASGTSSPVTLAAGQAITTIDAGLHTDVGLHEVSVFQSITAPLTTGQLQDLNGCGATYGPSAPAHFTEPGPIITN